MKRKFRKQALARFFGTHDSVQYGLVAALLVIFTLLMLPDHTVIRHSLKVGDVAKRNIKAPRDFIIEDTLATETNRRLAADRVLTVYDLDKSLSGKLEASVRNAFSRMRSHTTLPGSEEMTHVTGPPEPMERRIRKKMWDAKPRFETHLGITLSDGAFRVLVDEKFSVEISDIIAEVLREILDNGVVANKTLLLEEMENGILLRTVGTDSEQKVKNLRRFYGPDQARTMVRIVGEPLLKDVNYNLLNLIVDLTQRLIRPNISLNRNETEKRIQAAISDVKPVLFQIKAGEMLLREGERVTPIQLVKLKKLADKTRKQDLVRKTSADSLLMLLVLVSSYFLCLKRPVNQNRNPNKNMLFLAVVLASFLVIAKGTQVLLEHLASGGAYLIPPEFVFLGLPIAAASMIVCLFFGMAQALPFSLVTGVLTATVTGSSLPLLLYFSISGAMGAFWVRDCRERKVFVKAGWKLGVLHFPIAVGVAFHAESLTVVGLGWGVVFGFTSGIVAGILTAGVAPLLELLFDYTTDIKLLELANPDQPLLRRLMLEAPGTYNHAMIVGTLAEAAASEIGAHSLLARVGGYYHDIGKLSKPLYFIENQGGGKNRHDKLAPSLSALILITHVKDGVAMAKKHKLGEAIIDIIREHHGQSLIQFFFDKAKNLKGETETVNPDDYRYPGPRPQSREAAIVMMADVVEAASRTLDNPTPARIKGLVQKMINKIFSDSQLDECDITLKDLHKIAKSFNQILNGIYHHRIEYAESAAPGGGKRKHGHSDRQPADRPSDSDGDGGRESDAHLKRLGMS